MFITAYANEQPGWNGCWIIKMYEFIVEWLLDVLFPLLKLISVH